MNVTDLKTVIAGKLNHCPLPHFYLWLCGVFPHLCALTQCVRLNQDLKISMFCPNIIVETHLLNENARKISPVVVMWLLMVFSPTEDFVGLGIVQKYSVTVPIPTPWVWYWFLNNCRYQFYKTKINYNITAKIFVFLFQLLLLL